MSDIFVISNILNYAKELLISLQKYYYFIHKIQNTLEKLGEGEFTFLTNDNIIIVSGFKFVL